MKKQFVIILTIFILFMTTTRVWAFEALVVKSIKAEPYDKALDGFKIASGADIMECEIDGGMGGAEAAKKAGMMKRADVVVAIGREALALAIEEAGGKPIVYCMVMRPESLGIDRYDGIVKGSPLTASARDQLAKIESIMPGYKSIGVVYDQKNSGTFIKEAKTAAKELGIELIAAKARTGKDVPRATRKLAGMGIDAFWLLPDATVISIEAFDYILLLTLENKIPLITYSDSMVKSGAFLSLSYDYFAMGEHAATLAQGIINKGYNRTAKDKRDLKLHVSINIKSAQKLNIKTPDEIIRTAKNVYE